MTPEEQALLDRQKQIARTAEIKIRRHEPAEGQPMLSGWDLVTSRPLTAEQAGKCDEQVREEAAARGGKSKGKSKVKKGKS